MNDRKYQKIKVKCPISGTLEPMTIIFIKDHEGTYFPLPANGCENLCGNPICTKCCSAITLMFYKGYEYSVGEIISPDFSILK
jgi:hypothetical protein